MGSESKKKSLEAQLVGLGETFKSLFGLYMADKERLDFIQILIDNGIPVGFKPDNSALVGSVLTNGSKDIRKLIDKLIQVNNEEISPDAYIGGDGEKTDSANFEDKGQGDIR
jgi:hypothetical protein